MSLIINCEKCERKMGSLEPYKVRDDKYLCIKCFDALEKEQKSIQNIYDSVPDECIPWAFGVLKEPDIETKKQLEDAGILILPPPKDFPVLKAPDFPYDGILTGIVPTKSTFTTDQFESLKRIWNNISPSGKIKYVDLTSNIIPSPSVNNTITFYNSLSQQLSNGTLLSIDMSQSGKITIIANILAMFDLMSIAKITFTLDNMFSSYSVKLNSNIITTDTHYSFLVQLEFNIV